MTYSVLGKDEQDNDVQIFQKDRREGTYIIGATGAGKSTLIENLIMQDINQGLGVCLIDPHGDLTNAVLSRMQKRIDDVILIDLSDREYVAPFNLFFCENPDDPFDSENVVSAFMHIMESSFGISDATARMNQYFINIARLLIYNPDFTLLDIKRLLTDDELLKKLLLNVRDPDVVWFWKDFYLPYSKGTRRMEDISMISNKLDEFTKPVMRPWFGDVKKAINFRHFMDERKLVFIKLNSQWESLTKLLGNIIIAQLLDAAYSRRNIPINKRKQMNVYVDEVQNFASPDFSRLFTEARKYGLGITIAHQVFEMLDLTVKATCKQAANIVVFRLSPDNAKEVAGTFDTTPPKGEMQKKIKTIPVTTTISYTVYDESVRPQLEAIKQRLEELRIVKWALCPMQFSLQVNDEENEKTSSVYYEHILNRHGFKLSDLPYFPANARKGIYVHHWSVLHMLCEKDVFSVHDFSYLCNLMVKEDQRNQYLHNTNRSAYYQFPPDFPTLWEANFELEKRNLNEFQKQEEWRNKYPILAENIHPYIQKRQEFLQQLRTVLYPFLKNAQYIPIDFEKVQAIRKVHLRAYAGFFQWWKIELLKEPISWEMYTFPEAYAWYQQKVQECLQEQLNLLNEYLNVWQNLEKIVTEIVFTGDEIPDEEIIGYQGAHLDIPITRQRYEWVEGSPPYGSDEVEKRTANEIKQLPRFTAKIRMESGEYKITTVQPTGYLNDRDLQIRIADIQQQNLDKKYLRKREDVEAEIMQRRKGFQLSLTPSQTQHRVSRQVPLDEN